MNASTAPISLLPRSVVALAALVATSCGESEPESTKPIPDGKAEYRLEIETVADDCEPPLVSGDLGPVIVFVRTDELFEQRLAYVPVYHHDPEGPTRWDVRLDEQGFVADRRVDVQPPCSSAFERDEVDLLRANPTRMDVDWKWSVRGVETCEGGLAWATRDCSSHRVYHFQFVRACEPEPDLETCRAASQ